MKQLEAALRAAGYRPTSEIRAERDRAIGALVKARKQKRRGAKQLKARVLTLVSALKIPAPVAMLAVVAFVVLGVPSLALAHTGHDGGAHHMNAGGAVVLVGLTLGLAAHAWANWGPRRRLVAAVEGGPSEPAGGSEPEPEPEPESSEVSRVRLAYAEGLGAPLRRRALAAARRAHMRPLDIPARSMACIDRAKSIAARRRLAALFDAWIDVSNGTEPLTEGK